MCLADVPPASSRSASVAVVFHQVLKDRHGAGRWGWTDIRESACWHSAPKQTRNLSAASNWSMDGFDMCSSRFKPPVRMKPLACIHVQGATCLSTAVNIITQPHATNSHQNQFHFLAWRHLTEPLLVHNSSPLLTQICFIAFIKKNKKYSGKSNNAWTPWKLDSNKVNYADMQTDNQGLKLMTCSWHVSTRLQSCVTSDRWCRFSKTSWINVQWLTSHRFAPTCSQRIGYCVYADNCGSLPYLVL